MTLGLLGKKIGMTRVVDETGQMIPVTVIQAGPCPVVQVKREATDGYTALQVGFTPKREDRTNKPLRGHFAKAGVAPQRYVRELRVDDPGDREPGQALDVTVFEVGDIVDVVGTSKGRGFAGPIKRHNNSRGPESHGSRYQRRTGSLGASATPSRVMKGKPMAGRMGNERVTVQNLKILRIDPQNNLLVVKGAVPGHPNALVTVKKSRKAEARAARGK